MRRGEFGIGMDGGDLVTGHFDLGDDHHMVGGGKGHQLFHFGLRVETGAGIEHVVHGRTRAALGNEARIFLDLDAPSLIVHEVEVQGVVLVARHLRDNLLQAGKRNKRCGRDRPSTHERGFGGRRR